MPKRNIVLKENKFSKEPDEENLFPDEGIKEDIDDVDHSDSEESVYSGLEEEDSSGTDGDISGSDDDDEDNGNGDEDTGNVDQIDSLDSGNEQEEATNDKNIKEQERIRPIFEDVDTSDEEEIRNTVGNIPMEWYNEYPHIGYDIKGNKIMRPAQGDQLDDFLSKMDNPDYWRTVFDKTNMDHVKLTDEEVAMIAQIQHGGYAESSFDPFQKYVDYFTADTMVTPIKDNPEPKSRFVPSKWEHKRVMKIVNAIRNGWIKPKVTKDDKPQFYLIWNKTDQKEKDHPMHWPAPKLKLPGHDESYNPPPEYLPTEEEIATWNAEDPEERKKPFLPQKFNSLREVCGYKDFIKERFERCLDLYLCPRQQKMRVQVDPEDLIPKLPRPRDLQPFPTTEALVYREHTAAVRSIAVDPTGQWLVSGGSDCQLCFWEVSTTRCLKKIKFDDAINCVAWNPSLSTCLVAVASGKDIKIINPQLGDKLNTSNTDNILNGFNGAVESAAQASNGEWKNSSDEDKVIGYRLTITHQKPIREVKWHYKGDYFAVVMPEGASKSVVVHQLSKRKSQCPFSKSKGLIQCIEFHPSRPFFFVATQNYVRVYNLQKQELTKKLFPGVKWISSIAIHPKGDNLIVGSYDKRLCWFDMDLSTKAYKVLRHHKKAIRQVSFHQQYPLFASCGDDGQVIVCHGTVYNDLMQNPLIVPVKILRGHKITNDLGVTDCIFHPTQPWIFTAGADHTIRLFC